jgi:hypothetical protein
MFLRTIFAISLMIVRFLLAVKVISWIILEIVTPSKQSISDIELYLIGMFLDLWLFSNVAEIVIKDDNDLRS